MFVSTREDFFLLLFIFCQILLVSKCGSAAHKKSVLISASVECGLRQRRTFAGGGDELLEYEEFAEDKMYSISFELN